MHSPVSAKDREARRTNTKPVCNRSDSLRSERSLRVDVGDLWDERGSHVQQDTRRVQQSRSTHLPLCSAHVARQLSDNRESLCELCLPRPELSVDLRHALCVCGKRQCKGISRLGTSMREDVARLSIPPPRTASSAFDPVEMWKTVLRRAEASVPDMKALGASLAAASLILSTLISERPWDKSVWSETAENEERIEDRAHLDLSERFAGSCRKQGFGVYAEGKEGRAAQARSCGQCRQERVTDPAALP